MKQSPIPGTVYSTDSGRTCPDCGKAIVQCACAKTGTKLLGDGNVKITRSTKGRKGKGVSIISGLALTLDELKQLAKELKTVCGTGGSVKNNCIEIQGDQRELLVQELEKRGIKAKIAGG